MLFRSIAAGWLLRRFVFRAEAFWEAIESITYFALFPALLIASIANASMHSTALPTVVIVAVVMSLVATALVSARSRLGIEGPAFTSVFQGAIRCNTYIGLAAAATLHGVSGTALLAVALAVAVPLANVFCVAVLAQIGRAHV